VQEKGSGPPDLEWISIIRQIDWKVHGGLTIGNNHFKILTRGIAIRIAAINISGFSR
jgi:hypothetical protein